MSSMQFRSVISGVLVLNAVFLFGASPPADKPPRVQKGVSVICVEAETGAILYEKNADVVRAPASMIKLMLMLLVSEGLDEDAWTLDTVITASRHAQNMGGTQVYLAAGEEHSLRILMHAVSVASANDAAMAVAEQLWGSEDAYKARMNERAQELGMTSTEFNSVHGLPPSRGMEPDKTTARDMALLGQACVSNPQVREWVAMKQFSFRSEDNIFRNTNKLLWRMDDCDGLKTGYIRAAGFCVTATVERGGMRLVVVVMGHKEKVRRFALAEELFDYGFQHVGRKKFASSGFVNAPSIAIDNCETPEVTLQIDGNIVVTAKKTDLDRMELKTILPASIAAPIQSGTSVGELQLVLDGEMVQSVPLIVPVDLDGAGWLWKIRNRVETFVSAR